jgi:hypothetical protein
MVKKIFSDEKGRFQIFEITSEMLQSIETLEMGSIITAAFHGLNLNDFNKPDGFCVTPLGEVVSLAVKETSYEEWKIHVASNSIEPVVLRKATPEMLLSENLTEEVLFDSFMS